MARSSRFLFALSLASWWAGRFVVAGVPNGNASFQWSFGSDMISTELTQCGTYSVTVASRNDSNSSLVGVAPYYLIAYKASGIPTTSYIGTDPTSLSWQVDQPSGSSLVLTVADAVGNSGGEPPAIYTVTDGASSCLPKAPSVNVTLAANVTGTLQTCQPLGLRVYGGQKPYNISVAALNSPVITNVTLGPTDDVLTWINRANPDGQLLVSVCDANGTWGTSTAVINTAGSNDTDCTGLRTTAGNSADVNQHPPQPSGSHTTVIVAVVVPVCAVLLLATAFFFFWRRRKQQQMREPEPAFMPDAWTGPGAASDGADSTFSPYGPPPSSKLERYRDDVASQRVSHVRNSSSNIGLSPLLAATPQHATSYDGQSASGSSSHGRSPSGSKTSPRLPPGVSREWGIEPDIIIQHRDGGAAVQEIPPPYIGPNAVAGSSNVAGPSNIAGPSNVAGSSNSAGPSGSGVSGSGSRSGNGLLA